MTTQVTQWLNKLLSGIGGKTQTGSAHGGGENMPVEVYTATNAMEAEAVRAMLESEGIPAHTGGTALSDVYGLQIGPLAEVKVFTVAALAERAQQIIDERYLEADGAEWEFEDGWDKDDIEGD
jgi:hypothetical protein